MSHIPRPASPRKPTTGTLSNRNPSSLGRTVAASTPTRKPNPFGNSPRATPSTIRNVRSRANLSEKTDTEITEDTHSSSHLSVRDAIARKRAEAKKAQASRAAGDAEDAVWNGGRGSPDKPAEQDDGMDLKRWNVVETIDRARLTGSLNISSRLLHSIPQYLFESHLGIVPEPLKNAPPEEHTARSGSGKTISSWQAQDLSVLKARDNSILEIQPEIALFGSLKLLDLHNNKLTSLPDCITDLVYLTNLDLSQNLLTSLPRNLASLPMLAALSVSHNRLPSISFDLEVTSTPRSHQDSFFTQVVPRATVPFPQLAILDAAHNLLTGESMKDAPFPKALTKVDLSGNQLGNARELFQRLAQLHELRTMLLQSCGFDLQTFASPVVTLDSQKPFPRLELLDMMDSGITPEQIKPFLSDLAYSCDVNEERKPGDIQVILHQQVKKEQWEIDIERRISRKQSVRNLASSNKETTVTIPAPPPALKESWELEAEQGLLTEGGRRRARAIAAQQNKEEAAQAHVHSVPSEPELSPKPTTASSRSPSPNRVPSLSAHYTQSTLTLQLPSSNPRPKAHARAFSLVANLEPSGSKEDLLVPNPTLPLSLISQQSFARTLRVLTLSNRRVDPSFMLPESTENVLPALDELNMDGCALNDSVVISQDGLSGTRSEPLLQIIARLFPSLSTLNLSYNLLTTLNGADALIIPDWDKRRKGLKVFRLQGNRLADIEALEAVAEGWKDEKKVDGWRLEELDLRENEIAKLPPTLGLLPLDVLLVEGNLFRVPGRRVWEREGMYQLLILWPKL
ncbi:hypothetical protein SISSUDRAFT_1016912 [Sistotremastrum suecicum HHB10207 ss-3]|uniref:L domain-like protein n=1 Tax=Sistotremastrum suecicum HHB10207 ss-3 TaxID=1314776 RepID=A0A166GLW5_9AGAM|nr:hypothetical protein SISSUDRAFT_1016912 [Sistotremastrum suecicum HHB10207 ss-3]